MRDNNQLTVTLTDDEVKTIANKGIELEKAEREKRKKLREVWTQPLDLKTDDGHPA